mmetsp:Transcript_3273/g.6879  ORF Transcript_3273/g.6879 Transcript_3273/m.6879 type:complete len:504 (+) Transcript_3273:389-1900(+)
MLLPVLAQGPLEGDEVGVVDLELTAGELGLGILLGKANGPVLERGENSSGNIGIVHGLVRAIEEAAGEHLARLDGHRRQLGAALHDVPDGIDVGHGSLLKLADHLPVLRVRLDTHGVAAELGGVGAAADGPEDGVVDIGGAVGERHLDSAVRLLLELRGGHALPELHAVVLHVSADLVGDLPVEAPEEDGPDGDSGVKAKAGEEAGALEGDVGGPDAQGLAGGLLQAEQVVGRDGEVAPLAIDGGGPPSRGDDEPAARDRRHLPLLVSDLERVCVDKLAQSVLVSDILLAEVDAVVEVEAANVVLDALAHLDPVVAGLLLRNCEPERSRVLREDSADEGGVVHELLRDAANVDARAAEAPGGAGGRGLDIVEDGSLGAKARGLLGGGEAARASADHYEIIVVTVAGGVAVGYHGGLGLGSHSRGGHERLAPLKGVVASADEGTPRLVPRLDPRKGRAGLLAGLGDAKLVPEPQAVGRAQEPRAVLVAGGIHVVYDAEAGGEED